MEDEKIRIALAKEIEGLGRGGLTRVAEKIGVCRSYMSMMISGDRPLCPLVVAKYRSKGNVNKKGPTPSR